MLVAGFITAVLMMVIGGAMDRHQRKELDRKWDEYGAAHGGRPSERGRTPRR